MNGRLIAVVGPSGVGKDTVMEAVAAQSPQIRLARRVITRPAALGGEAFEGVSEEEFLRRRDLGEFALSWQAHDLWYGIPALVDAELGQGRDVMANLSRAVLAVARTRFPGLVVLSLTAPASVLAARLAMRGREGEAQIAQRLSRTASSFAADPDVIEIANDGDLQQTVDIVLERIYPERSKRWIS